MTQALYAHMNNKTNKQKDLSHQTQVKGTQPDGRVPAPFKFSNPVMLCLRLVQGGFISAIASERIRHRVTSI
jgi:hypothetical protein